MYFYGRHRPNFVLHIRKANSEKKTFHSRLPAAYDAHEHVNKYKLKRKKTRAFRCLNEKNVSIIFCLFIIGYRVNVEHRAYLYAELVYMFINNIWMFNGFTFAHTVYLHCLSDATWDCFHSLQFIDSQVSYFETSGFILRILLFRRLTRFIMKRI